MNAPNSLGCHSDSGSNCVWIDSEWYTAAGRWLKAQSALSHNYCKRLDLESLTHRHSHIFLWRSWIVVIPSSDTLICVAKTRQILFLHPCTMMVSFIYNDGIIHTQWWYHPYTMMVSSNDSIIHIQWWYGRRQYFSWSTSVILLWFNIIGALLRMYHYSPCEESIIMPTYNFKRVFVSV